MPTFTHEGQRLDYTVFGEGPRVTVLVHGLLFNQRMHVPLAQALAERGNRVVTLDLLGHGASDRPHDMWRYSMSFFGAEVLALLDHLEVDQAVLGGTSLGANVTLEAVSAAPERVRGMVIEMPVLDNALLACALVFTPLMVGVTFGEPVWRLAGRGIDLARRALPLPYLADLVAEWVAQDPAPSAAVLQGLFFGRIAPHRSERRTFQQPALIIGHDRDPVHPFSDSDMLAGELPNARLVQASSFFEMRIAPRRLTGEIAGFIDECWKPIPAEAGPRKRRSSRKASA